MKTAAKPLVSILCPVFNNVKYTLDCIGSVRAFTKVPYEIVVCGTGTDGTIGSMMEMERTSPNFKFIHNDTENTHFAANVNLGAKHCTGDFICLLNNDTIVTPRWIEKMLNVYNKLAMMHERNRPCPPPAVIAPVSNYVMQHQMVRLPPDFKLDQIPEVGETVEKESRGRWYYSAVVSGFCMLIKRDVFEQLEQAAVGLSVLQFAKQFGRVVVTDPVAIAARLMGQSASQVSFARARWPGDEAIVVLGHPAGSTQLLDLRPLESAGMAVVNILQTGGDL